MMLIAGSLTGIYGQSNKFVDGSSPGAVIKNFYVWYIRSVDAGTDPFVKGRKTLLEESGVYTLNGDSMTITPKKSQTRSNSEGLKNNPLEMVTYRWTIHYFEGIGEYALILHPDHQTKRDGGFDYVLAFPNSYSYSRVK